MIKSLIAKNFLSWADIQFQFNSGITLIEGKNHDENKSEGSGKSSVFYSLSWGLYGQMPSKEINIDEVIREGTDSCYVRIFLETGHEVFRSRNPNELYVVDPEGNKIKGKDAKETQKKINNLLGMSFETFCQSVLFAQNYNKKFITATQEEKSKILSELQDLSWCDKSAKLAQDKYKEVNQEILRLDSYLVQKKESLGIYVAQLKLFTEMDDKFEHEKNLKVIDLSNKANANMAAIDELTAKITELGPQEDPTILTEKMKVYEAELTRLTELSSYIRAIKLQYEAAKAAKDCPTCGQPICKEVKEPVYPENPELLSNRIDELKELVTKTGINLLQQQQKASTIRELNFKKTYLVGQGFEINTELQKASEVINSYKDKIKESKSQIMICEATISEIQNKSNSKHLEASRLKTLRDGFKELKSHMFKNLLVELNNKANKYVQELFDISASIRFTNVSEDDEISKIITKVYMYGQERSLGLLSGGQGRRVQIAVDFALSELVAERTGNPINIRLLDEPFKDLCNESKEKIVGLLEHMQGCTVIIEHDPIIKSIVNQTFQVQLVDKVSSQV